MGYIIVDLEFNNLKNITNYNSEELEKYEAYSSVNLENEIIEIGAVKVDKYMKPVCKMREYIKPVIFPMINPKVEEITKINMDLLKEKGIPFKEAIDKFKKIFEDGDILCSWAKDDVVELIRNADYHNYDDIGWLNKYIDLQEYATKVLAHKKALGLKNAVEELRIKVDDNKLHDALYDSECTVEVFKRVYNYRMIKNYIIKDIYNMPAIHISNLQEISIEEDNLKLKCPKCGSRIALNTSLKLLNWRFAAVGKCGRCKNNILCEVVVKKTLKGDKVYSEVNSIIKDEDYWNYIYKLEKDEVKN